MVETTIVEDEDTMVMVQSEVQTEKKKRTAAAAARKPLRGFFHPMKHIPRKMVFPHRYNNTIDS